MISRTAQTDCGRCGWQSKLSSPALAARALVSHSCERTLRRQSIADIATVGALEPAR